MAKKFCQELTTLFRNGPKHYRSPEYIVFRCQDWSSEAASPLETAVSLSQVWSSEAASASETAASLSQRARPRAGST